MRYDSWFDSDENRTLMAICTRKLIRNIGIGGIIWGVINMGLGAAAIPVVELNAGILILGVLMLGTGVQALRSPTLGVLLTETIVAVLLFLWNLGISILNLRAGEEFVPRGLVFPLIIAVVSANHYRKLGSLRDRIASVTREKIEAAQRICKAILKKKLKDESLIVQTADRKCRAQLMDDQAFFIQRDLLRAFVAKRDAVLSAVAQPEAKSWALTFNHPLGKLKYRFDKNNTGKLRTWASGEGTAITPPPQP